MMSIAAFALTLTLLTSSYSHGPAAPTTATHIFAIGCVLPTAATASGKARVWDDVPDDQGDGPRRDATVRHVKTVLTGLY